MRTICCEFIYRSLALLALAMSAGCATVRQARLVQSGREREAGEYRISAERMGLGAESVLSLAELEKLALTHHPSAQRARQAVVSARQRCRMVGSGRLPQISAGAGYQRATRNIAGMPRSASTDGEWIGNLELGVLLYDFGELRAEERQAAEELVAAEAQLQEALLEVVYNLRMAFFEKHRATHLRDVARESEKQFARHLDEVRSMVEVGLRRPYDLTKAEVDLGNAQLEVVGAANAATVAQARLNRALGLTENAVYTLGAGHLSLPSKSEEDLMRHARDHSPALAIAHARERAASAYVDQTIAELYPSLSAGAEVKAAASGFPLLWNFSGFVRMLQNIFDGRRKTARIEEAVAQLRMMRAEINDTEQELYLALVGGEAEMRSAARSADIARLIQKQAEDNLAIVNEQYRVGLSSAIERTDAQLALTEARTNVIRAEYDEQKSIATLLRLIGAPLEIDENHKLKEP